MQSRQQTNRDGSVREGVLGVVVATNPTHPNTHPNTHPSIDAEAIETCGRREGSEGSEEVRPGVRAAGGDTRS